MRLQKVTQLIRKIFRIELDIIALRNQNELYEKHFPDKQADLQDKPQEVLI